MPAHAERGIGVQPAAPAHLPVRAGRGGRVPTSAVVAGGVAVVAAAVVAGVAGVLAVLTAAAVPAVVAGVASALVAVLVLIEDPEEHEQTPQPS